MTVGVFMITDAAKWSIPATLRRFRSPLYSASDRHFRERLRAVDAAAEAAGYVSIRADLHY